MKNFKNYLLLSFFVIFLTSALSQSNDIYLFDVKNGIDERATFLDNKDEYNVTFNNNGSLIAYDVLGFDPFFTHDIYITDINSGDTYPLEGGDGGNDASWSPNGNFIAFDRGPYGDPSAYYVEASGGERTLIRAYGDQVDWSNNSQRIVFRDFFDWTIRTIKMDGTDEKIVSPYGAHPTWSPNGKYIAFVVDIGIWANIFVVEVDEFGEANAFPTQVTFDPEGIYNNQPSWSNNGKFLVFHSNRTSTNFEFDIWKLEMESGEISKLTGTNGIGDYDPCFSINGKYVGYSAFTEHSSADAISRNSTVTLNQSFPNPFKNSTNIVFNLESKSRTQLIIYDQLGKVISTLFDTDLDAGIHEFQWIPNIDVSGGIYTMKLISGKEMKTQQIVFLGH